MAVIRKTVAEQVADTLVAAIESGQIKPGQKIKNEFELAADLNVGRGSVREAVKQLVSRGILEIRRGDGTYVQKQPGVVSDPLGFAFDTDKKKLASDLCEFRLLMEPQAAALAAQRANDQEIEEIQRRCQACSGAIRQGSLHFEADIAFHSAIVAATHNDVLMRTIPMIHEGIGVFLDFRNQDELVFTMRIHEQISEAVGQRNPEKAAEAMRRHMQENQRWIHQLLDDGE